MSVTRHVFALDIAPGKADLLAALNGRYQDALQRVAAGIDGLRSIQKYVLGDRYIEIIDLDGDFTSFATQLAADPEVRQFLREVGACFTQSLRHLIDQRMTPLQVIDR